MCLKKGPFQCCRVWEEVRTAVRCWGYRYPLAHTSMCACSREKATLSLKLHLTALLSPQKLGAKPHRFAQRHTCRLPPPEWKCEAETETASCVDREKPPGSGVCLGGSFPLPRWVLSLPEPFCCKACSSQGVFFLGGEAGGEG